MNFIWIIHMDTADKNDLFYLNIDLIFHNSPESHIKPTNLSSHLLFK